MNSVITLKNITASYDQSPVLKDITLSIQKNEFLGIIGPNGGGKSTLIKVILGLIKPDSGQITVCGHEPKFGCHHIAYVPQYFRFASRFPLKVWDVVLMGRLSKEKIFHRYSNEDKEAAKEALNAVSLFDLKNRPISDLSLGQRQRVFIARALAKKADVLILDEPTANIDLPMQQSLYDLLRKFSQKMTLILVTHDLGVISSYVDTIACLNQKLHYHGKGEMDPKILEEAYHCPVEVIGHGHTPHRVLKEHEK